MASASTYLAFKWHPLRSTWGCYLRGVCLFDNRGFLCVSPLYAHVFGDFVGGVEEQGSISALRDISLSATGIDYITSDVVDKRVGFVIDQQLPMNAVVGKLCAAMGLVLLGGRGWRWYDRPRAILVYRAPVRLCHHQRHGCPRFF